LSSGTPLDMSAKSRTILPAVARQGNFNGKMRKHFGKQFHARNFARN
jgi:hypothetical protein